MSTKKEVRKQFREAVFARDGHKCRTCGLPSPDDSLLDAHHIIDRNEMPNGGYVVEDGISLCKIICHLKAEKFHITEGKEWEEGFHPDDLFKLIGSSRELAILKAKELK